MKKFEYDMTFSAPNDMIHLNERGKVGWELVAIIVHDYKTNRNYWKRALPESNDKTETK